MVPGEGRAAALIMADPGSAVQAFSPGEPGYVTEGPVANQPGVGHECRAPCRRRRVGDCLFMFAKLWITTENWTYPEEYEIVPSRRASDLDSAQESCFGAWYIRADVTALCDPRPRAGRTPAIRSQRNLVFSARSDRRMAGRKDFRLRSGE
jgi:hypothetical protein